MEVVDKARVPIIKFVDGTSGVSVDVCLEETSGLQSSQLARKATKQFPAFGVLVLFLKRFLNTRGLHDTFTGGVGSFLLQLLVICSLQHPPTDGVRRHHGAAPRGNLASALLHFFETFGLRLNYEAVVVSVRDGGRFLSKRSRGKQWCARDRTHLLSVENPLDTNHDVAANSYNILSVRRVWSHAYFATLSTLEMVGDGTTSQSSGGRLQVLGGLLNGLEEEMATRFEAHAAERRAGGGTPAALSTANGGTEPAEATEAGVGKRKREERDVAANGGTNRAQNGKRRAAAVDAESGAAEDEGDGEEQSGDDEMFVADDDGDDSDASAEPAADLASELFSLREARRAFPANGELDGRKRKLGALDTAEDVDSDAGEASWVIDRAGRDEADEAEGGRSEQLKPARREQAHTTGGKRAKLNGAENNAEAAQREQKATSGASHPRALTKKERRLKAIAKKEARKQARGERRKKHKAERAQQGRDL